jgi:hypothetical protein
MDRRLQDVDVGHVTKTSSGQLPNSKDVFSMA